MTFTNSTFTTRTRVLLLMPFISIGACTEAESAFAGSESVSLTSLDGLRIHKVAAEVVSKDGREVLHVTEAPGVQVSDEDRLVIVGEIEIANGTIEMDLIGAPQKSAGEFARGFVGVAFRIAQDVSSFDAIYLRPTNGRAANQLRRNHSTQYISFPDYPWHKLRNETPGGYESYVDLVPGEWTHVRIELVDNQARLYVHRSEQPSLIVTDLKSGNGKGAVGLWIGPGTDAYFSNLKIRQQ